MSTILLDCLAAAKSADVAALAAPKDLDHDAKRRVEAYRAANLHDHARELEADFVGTSFGRRRARAEAVGFRAATIPDLVADLMGSRSTKVWLPETETKNRHRYERFLWRGGKTSIVDVYPVDFLRIEGRWPFRRRAWTCRLGVVARLAGPIPYGVVLKMNELWETRTFSCFHAIAPEGAWRAAPVRDVDPIVVATIFPDDRDFRRRPDLDGVHYPVARWS